jgi:hypothetical protein
MGPSAVVFSGLRGTTQPLVRKVNPSKVLQSVL